MVGSREQHLNYKNGNVLFRAIEKLPDCDFDVVCVGGEPNVKTGWSDDAGFARILRLELTDCDLALAYNGAEALIYPSLYEGFGLPIIEALACGCPVVATDRGPIREIGGPDVIYFDGTSEDSLLSAIQLARDADQHSLRKRRADSIGEKFPWSILAGALGNACMKLAEKSKAGEFDGFFKQWSRLRDIQAKTDY